MHPRLMVEPAVKTQWLYIVWPMYYLNRFFFLQCSVPSTSLLFRKTLDQNYLFYADLKAVNETVWVPWALKPRHVVLHFLFLWQNTWLTHLKGRRISLGPRFSGIQSILLDVQLPSRSVWVWSWRPTTHTAPGLGGTGSRSEPRKRLVRDLKTQPNLPK